MSDNYVEITICEAGYTTVVRREYSIGLPTWKDILKDAVGPALLGATFVFDPIKFDEWADTFDDYAAREE